VDVKTYDDFDKLDIDDGESAWVGGYAEFGPGLARYDCFQIQNDTTHQLKSGEMLYECATMCSSHKYIAVKYRRCICLPNDDFIRDHAQCEDTNADIFGVYQVDNRTQQTAFQCTAFKYNIIGVESYSFDKCSSRHMSLCVGGASSLDDSCKAQYTSVSSNVSNCLIKERKPWSEGFEMCQRFNGRMLPLALDQNWLVYLPNIPDVEKQTVWLGTLRTFRISDSQTSTACLSVTKVMSHLFLEPADCSRMFQFICTADLITKQEHDLNTPINVPILVAVFVSIVIVLVIVLVFVMYRTQCVCKLLQLGKGHRQVTQQTSTSALLQMNAVREDDVGYSNPLDGVYYSTVDDDTRDDVMRDVTRDQQHTASIEPVPQESEYNVALNYNNDKHVDVDGPRNVYAHCVRTNNRASGDYDVHKLY